MTVDQRLLAVIVNYRTPDMTLKAVGAAVRALQPLALNWSVLLLDNGSGDDSLGRLRKAVADRTAVERDWRRVTVTASEINGGFGFGVNAAVRRAAASDGPADYVYLLNSDAFPSRRAVAALLEHLDSNPRVGVAGSQIHGPDNAPHCTAFRFPTVQSEFEDAIKLGLVTRLLRRRVVPLGIPKTDTRVDWVAGASMLIRGAALRDAGLFDESFFLYFEETDLCRRMAAHGWSTAYVPASRVEHVGSASTGMKRWRRVPQYWFDSRRHYFVKHHGRAYLTTANAARVAGGCLLKLRGLIQRGAAGRSGRGFELDLLRHSFRHAIRGIQLR